MARITLGTWLVRARWQIARLGAAGRAGAGLLVLMLVFFIVAVMPRKQALEALKSKVEAMQQVQPDAAGQTRLNNNQALQIFYDFLPRNDSSPYWISELDRIAKESGVELSSSDYRLMMEKDSKLTRYEIQLPLRGTYPHIRAFIAGALQAVPSLALADIVIRRESTLSSRLDARLTLYLYLNDY